MRILYNSKKEKYKTPFGSLKEGEKCTVNIYIPTSCKTKNVKIEFFGEAGGRDVTFKLEKQAAENDYDIFSATFSLDTAGIYFYRFYIVTENEEFPLYKYGYDMTNMCEGELWQLTCTPEEYKLPENFCGNVMYQIFPDRFNKSGNCDTKDKLKPFTIHKNLKDTPNYLADQNGQVLNNDFYGGNLKGISKKIGYLKKLGISVIYLNPIFKAYSNHRYDTADYKKIDELLGNENDFKRLCKKAHRNGIKIIIDGVFSHTGSNSVYFDKENIFKNGAVSSPASPYRQWYDFKNYPDDYVSWWGIKTLPCVNEMNSDYVDFIISGKDSVAEHWIKAGADGFRLDVADELPDEFIKKLRNRIKGLKHNSFLIGEVWEDASNKISYRKRRMYFSNGELDSVMNYPFRSAVIDFVLRKDGGENLKNTVMDICENYPKETLNYLMNMLSTHDTPRILSVLTGKDIPENKSEMANFVFDGEIEETAIQKLKCASLLQFFLPGIPCIYYGDEIGMQGAKDPFCRAFFDWEKQNCELKKYFQKLCRLKNKTNALKRGKTDVTVIENGFVKITRSLDRENAVLLLNVSENSKSALIQNSVFILNCKANKNIELPPYSAVVFTEKKEI